MVKENSESVVLTVNGKSFAQADIIETKRWTDDQNMKGKGKRLLSSQKSHQQHDYSTSQAKSLDPTTSADGHETRRSGLGSTGA